MKKYLIAATAAALIAPAAHAATITASGSVPLQGTEWTENFTLSQFDPSLGTLTGVTFTLNGLVDGTGGAKNFSATAANPTLSLQSTITATLGGTTLAVVIPTGTEQVSLTGNTSGFDPANCSQDDCVEGIELSGSASTTETVTDFSAFIGTGDVLVSGFAESTSSVIVSGNNTILGTFDTNAAADATVTYTYDEAVVPIPLPATAFLMLAALGSLLAFRRYS